MPFLILFAPIEREERALSTNNCFFFLRVQTCIKTFQGMGFYFPFMQGMEIFSSIKMPDIHHFSLANKVEELSSILFMTTTATTAVLWLINLRVKSIKNNRRDEEKVNFVGRRKYKIPRKIWLWFNWYSWWQLIESHWIFFRILVESNQRPWRYWGSEKYACKKKSSGLKIDFPLRHLTFFCSLSLSRR